MSRALAALALLGFAIACGGSGPGTSTAFDPTPAGPPVSVELRVRDLLAAAPRVARAELVLDGRQLRAPDGTLRLELAPGPHVLHVRDPRYRPDLAVLRFEGEGEPRAQTAGGDRLAFEVRPGDAAADLWLVPATLDARFCISLLDEAVSRRWNGPIDLHVDLSMSPSGWSLGAERVPELAAFADSALAELSGGALRLGRVTTGTGLTWRDFLEAERRGTITVQAGPLTANGPVGEVHGWALYREAERGVIRSANVFLSEDVLRRDREAWRGAFGHELGHALSLQHPLPCRRWSRMDGGGRCPNDLLADLAPGTFWGPADRAAGRLLYAFRAGTDFGALAPGS